jgi:Reverse transcriptase (RNA-dependent DNA polymerase)
LTNKQTADQIKHHWRLQTEGEVFFEDDFSGSKGVAILIKKECQLSNIETVYKSNRYILLKGMLNDQATYVHNVYAPVQQCEQEYFYDNLPRLDPTTLQIAGGDFNNVIDRLRDDNSISGQTNQSYEAFRRWRNENGLVDTWRYMYPDKATEFTHGSRRIDILLITDPLLENVYRIHHARKFSDHRSVKLTLQSTNWSMKKHPLWRLHTSLHHHQDVKKKILEILHTWTRDNEDARGQDLIKEYELLKIRLKNKLQALQHKLLNQDNKQRKLLYKKLALAKKCYIDFPTEATRKILTEATAALKLYKEAQSHKNINRGFQNARDHSEKCTTQFLRQITSELHKRPVVATSLLDGTISTDEDEIIQNHRRFWEKIYNPNPDDINQEIQAQLIHGTYQRISQSQRQYLEEEITEVDIRQQIEKLKGDCAPGSDCLTNIIFQMAPNQWSKILYRIYKENERQQKLAPTQRTAITALLFKKNDPHDPANYRPIALLNTDAKIYTKILTKRLRPIINTIIDDRQTGFMPGRTIHDNVRRIQDIIHWCIKTNSPGTLVLLDFQKAYDRVNWNYLQKLLSKIDFGPKFRNQIATLYCQRRFHIMLNNRISEPCIANSGVLQGDPLSCYLFAISLIPLMNLLENEKLKGIQIHPPHYEIDSYFADDTTIITTDMTTAISLYNKVDSHFCRGTGAQLHPKKTIYIPITGETYNDPTGELTILQPTQTTRLLGVHLGVEAAKCHYTHAFDTDLEKIEQRLKRWAKRGRTINGRIVILRTMIQSILYFKTSTIVPGQETIDTLEKTFIRFVNQTMDYENPYHHERKMSPINAKWLYLPKSKGGMGLKPIKSTFDTQKIKQMINLISTIERQEEPPTHFRPIIAIIKIKYSNPKDILQLPTHGHAAKELKDLLPRWWTEAWKLTLTKIANEGPLDETRQIWNNIKITKGNKTLAQRLRRANIHPEHINRLKALGLNHIGNYRRINANPMATASTTWISPRQLLSRIEARTTNVLALRPAVSFILAHLHDSLGINFTPDQVGTPWRHRKQNTNEAIPITKLKRTDIKQILHRPALPTNLNFTHVNLNYEEFTADSWKIMEAMKKITLPVPHDVRWRLMHNGLITGVRLQFSQEINPNCIFGCQEVESPWHLFWDCQMAQTIWGRYTALWRPLVTDTISWKHILDPSTLRLQVSSSTKFLKLAQTVFGMMTSIILHRIWFTRNHCVFDHPEATRDINAIFHKIDYSISLHWTSIKRSNSNQTRIQIGNIRTMLNHMGLFETILQASPSP